REDLARALERATRYRAFSWSAVERILAAEARPRSVWESLQTEAQEQIEEILRQAPVAARSTAEHQSLLEETPNPDEQDDEDAAAASSGRRRYGVWEPRPPARLSGGPRPVG